MSCDIRGPEPRSPHAEHTARARRAIPLLRRILPLALAMAISLALSPRSTAEVVADLHMAEVAVAGNSEADRAEAIRIGFEQVAIKRTGATELAGRQALALLAELAPTLLLRHEFAERTPARDSRETQGPAPRPHLIRLWFKPAETDAVLKGAGIELWPPDRPRVLLLVTINAGEAAGSHALARTGEVGAQVRVKLLDAARVRGLPVALPEVDATDQRIFSSYAARRDPMFPVRMLKHRYAADAVAVLLLELNQAATNWDSHWDLGVGPATATGSQSGVGIDQAIGDFVDGVVRALAGRTH